MILTVCASMFLVLTCIDMGVKQYIEDTFEKSEERETIIPGLVIRKVYNEGFAFNLLDKYPEVIKKSSVCAGIGILVYDLFLLFGKAKRIGKIGMTFVSAGAFSNIYDRLIRGKVIDYIGMKSENHFLSRWTANLADIYIVIGTLFVMLSRSGHKKKKKKNSKAGE